MTTLVTDTALNTDFVHRRINTLQLAYAKLVEHDVKSDVYDIYRAACVKEFEIVSEQCGKLLKKSLLAFFITSKQLDALTHKDIFRYAAKHDLMTLNEVERWLQYRDHRNQAAHEYGENYADEILLLLPQFLTDANSLLTTIEHAPRQ